MEKKLPVNYRTKIRPSKIVLLALLIFLSFPKLSAESLYQYPEISLNYNQATIGTVFNKIEQIAGIHFLYNIKDVNLQREVTIHTKGAALEDVISELLKGTDLTYEIENKQVVLYRKKKTKPTLQNTKKNRATKGVVKPRQQQNIVVQGTVTSDEGIPLMGVNIVVKGAHTGTATDKDGKYTLSVSKEATLVFSYLGFMDVEIQVKDRFKTIKDTNTLDITLTPSENNLEGVVITGVVKREKKSYTGAVRTVSGVQLKEIGNQNIIQSLKSLDPSLIAIENNNLGSNPNALPDIEIRGTTSAPTNTLEDQFGSDPNSPLFILDGFETDLQTVVDLNINRVESITILKDAASTALYGAKAANGVVVIETKKPQSGKLRFSYTGDFSVQFPDLRSYNLMNAEEKIKFEKLAGRWDSYVNDPRFQVGLDSIYNERLADVRRGVNTYWLSKPVQTVFTQRHSIYADGGDENFQYGAGLSLSHAPGVMKGSKRRSYNANIDLTYRKGNLQFSNRLLLKGSTGIESPYGSFRDYARANPYYKPRNEEGEITKYLDHAAIQGSFSEDIPNPLYNSTLNNENENRDFGFTDNFQFIWDINSALRINAGMHIEKTKGKQEVFISPESIQFDELPFDEKGSYRRIDNESSNYSGNIMLTYAKVFAQKHSFTANIRGELEEQSQSRYGTEAVGFPIGAKGRPNFAFQYKPDAHPSYATSKFRRSNLLASINYVYDQRYLLDATYRIDGSSSFGSKKRYSPFWSVGLGWNLHEEFHLNRETFDLLKLRANIGETGNQGFGNIVSVTTYGFNSSTNIFGQGTNIIGLGAPDLDWQKTRQTDLGLDLGMFNQRLSATFDVYEKYTNPLVVSIDLPSSTGVSNHPMNVGHMKTRGFEADLSYAPIYNLENRIIWKLGLTMSTYSSKYGGFNHTLDQLNEEGIASRSLIRFRDGFSPDDIWAVKSLGIDPATGKEVFLKNNGETTFTHDFKDERVVGNSRPDMEGVISTSFRYKNFSFGAHLRYQLGASKLNTALYNKVENLSRDDIAYNQDRRALTERWIKPGDHARFKGISLTSTTPISSRFVQKENVLIGESFRLGYDDFDGKWLDKFGLDSFSFYVYMNDIFRASTIKVERGIDYPFARTVSFSLNLTF